MFRNGCFLALVFAEDVDSEPLQQRVISFKIFAFIKMLAYYDISFTYKKVMARQISYINFCLIVV